jgi:hypothetical protein
VCSLIREPQLDGQYFDGHHRLQKSTGERCRVGRTRSLMPRWSPKLPTQIVRSAPAGPTTMFHDRSDFDEAERLFKSVSGRGSIALIRSETLPGWASP